MRRTASGLRYTATSPSVPNAPCSPNGWSRPVSPSAPALRSPRNRGCASPESGPEKLVHRIHVVRFNDVEQHVLRIRAVQPDKLEAGNVGVEERVRSPFIAGTGFWRMDLRNVEEQDEPWLKSLTKRAVANICSRASKRQSPEKSTGGDIRGLLRPGFCR